MEETKLVIIINPISKQTVDITSEESQSDEEVDDYEGDEEDQEKLEEEKPFDEDAALQLASASAESKKFKKKYPKSLWTVEQMKPTATKNWINVHPSADVAPAGVQPPKMLWIVELEELEKVKLILIISPLTKTILESKIEKVQKETED